MKPTSLLPRTVTLLVLIPVLVAGGITALISVNIFNSSLSSQLEEQAVSELRLGSSLAMEICDDNLEYILSLRLGHDRGMVETMKKDSLLKILELPSRLENIHFIVIEDEDTIAGNTLPEISEEEMEVLPPPQEEVVELSLAGGEGFAYSRYFPFFRWHIVSFAYSDEYFAPLTAGRRAVYLSILSVFLVFTGTLLLVFFYAVKKPLTELVNTSARVAKGSFDTVPTLRKDEIGGLISAFNSMVKDIEEDREKEHRMVRQLQESEKKIKVSLQEKEVLLQEIHHRVKNNLNIVVSLLNLQSDYIVTPEDAKRALEVSKSRVYSMALVHERLYKSENLSHIDMNSYVKSVVGELTSLYMKENISVRTNVEDIVLDITKAVPLGLILNELVTNALLHAFSEDEEGFVEVSFMSTDDEGYRLEVRDDGSGLPERPAEGEEQHLGLMLIRLLAAQIGADLTVKSEGGTHYIITV
ncbi:MAG: histidine kinase dimerization/phosphoacceptor domain -containing protein [Spirochaetia bacterium]